MVISVSGSYPAPLCQTSASHWRKVALPGMGAYWLCPASMAAVTACLRAGGVSRSGNPWATLSAPHALAKADISVKMVVPTWGILDRGALGVSAPCMLIE